jgi:dTDP-4-amino-4,6-dideoxygalactose transaminase
MAVEKRIPLSRPYLSGEELSAVKEVLESGWLAQGEKVRRFEEGIASYLGRKYSIAVSSGTAALHLALLANGLKRGDEVVVPTLTFVSTANTVVHTGAKAIFCDVDPERYTIDPESVRTRLSSRVKSLIPVHLYGHPADMSRVNEIATERQLSVIEDLAEGLGSEYRARRVGSDGRNTVCLSFHPVKTITTGEGGMIITDDPLLAERVRSLRSHGEDTSAWQSEHTSKPWARSFRRVGFNYRMSDIHAAIGLKQFEKIESFISTRRKNAKFLTNLLRDNRRLRVPTEAADCKHVFQYYVVLLSPEIDRDTFMTHLLKMGIGCGVHFGCVHLEPTYRELYGCDTGMCPVAEGVSRRAVTLPMYVGLTEGEMERIASSVTSAISKSLPNHGHAGNA